MGKRKLTENNLADLNSEKSILSCLIKKPSLIVESFETIQDSDFTNQNNRDLFRIFNTIYEESEFKKEPVFDLSSVRSVSKRHNIDNSFFEGVKGQSYFSILGIDPDCDIAAYSQYISSLKNASGRRRLYGEGLRIQRLSSDPKLGNPSEAIEDIYKSLSGISADIVGQSNEPQKLMTNAVSMIEERLKHPTELLGFTTGFEKLDEHIGGLDKGAVYVVAADTGVGKTALIMNMAWSAFYKHNIPVLFISTEMSDDEIFFRSISKLSQIEEIKIKKGFLNIEEKNKILEVSRGIASAPFYHIEVHGYSLETITSLIRRFIFKTVGMTDNKANDCLVIFDYIKLPDSMSSKTSPVIEKETQVLGMITTGLKNLAKQLKFPLLTAAQLNREGDVAASARIEWFANCIMKLEDKSPLMISNQGGQTRKTGNQILKITKSRGSSKFGQVDIYYDSPRLTMHQAQVQQGDNVIDPLA